MTGFLVSRFGSVLALWRLNSKYKNIFKILLTLTASSTLLFMLALTFAVPNLFLATPSVRAAEIIATPEAKRETNNECLQRFEQKSARQRALYDEITHSWQPISDFQRDVGAGSVLQAEIEYRERFNQYNQETIDKLRQKLSACEKAAAEAWY
ncbi:hypothetical protein N5923_11020 [Erwiniaceae bacterium BAC15a-03b]|uniref:Uncharacterized protein n=1 Tax=Winslowiella arboricola TaxID=2978220 RepID=A0A9J6PTG0_9GAMM|nr:hypothetical protein [Winslowiella arboricola]MCU5774570.1 hypothetical protein [Winslowiella arboricola]MCU5778020.1 hypothetical protein [Winslowiella arboricola]